MRTTVALVEARPETISEDYRRVLDLSGLSNLLAGEVPHLLVGTGNSGFEPGWSATPWQMHAVLNWLGQQAAGATAAAVVTSATIAITAIAPIIKARLLICSP